MKNETDEIQSLRKEIADISKKAFDRGLISGAGGNISARIGDTDTVLITPTGISLRDIEEESNIIVDLEGNVIQAPADLIPSKECYFHLAAYKLRQDVKAVVHVHPPYATAYANKSQSLPLVTIQSRLILKEVPWIECASPGSSELCEYVSQGIENNKGVKALLMKEHGILSLGGDLKTAFYIADLVEDTAKIAFITSNIS